MAFAEKRGKFWRARWKGQDGTLESESGFTSQKAAVKYGQAQEAKIAAGVQADERTGQITLTAWCNVWFPAQDLELNTLDTYKGIIELMILPRFGHLLLSEIEAHDVAAWEKELIAKGYKPRTAREARKLLSTIMGDAIPRYIKVNTAARKRGKGKKGQRRIAEAEKAEKVWPTPLQALLFAERCAVLTGDDSDFVLNITTFYTGARWSEIMGLGPKSVSEAFVNIHWKLYELNGRFYRGRPKDGSIRDADIPPFLWNLLEWQLDTHPNRKCTCANDDAPWCPGTEYVFLTPDNAHHRRSNYSSRIVRPAADGWHPGRAGRYGQPSMPVLVDMTAAWPGVPLPSWPAAVPGQHYAPPTGRGVARLVAREGFGRCPACARSTQLRQDGTMINHKTGHERCPGSLLAPGNLPAVASWLPLLAGLTEHGQRHAHQVMMDDLNIRYVLQADRMGHEVPGMRGIYKHIAPEWRADLVNGLQRVWEESLAERTAIAPRSAVPLLDRLLHHRGKAERGD